LLLVLMGGKAEGLMCADPGARTAIGASGNSLLPDHQIFKIIVSPPYNSRVLWGVEI
jgi:hypothetical protein